MANNDNNININSNSDDDDDDDDDDDTLGGTLRIRTSNVCKITLENLMPTGENSMIRSMSSMKMMDSDDLYESLNVFSKC